MSSRFVVELDRRVVGLALRCRGGFRFFASEDKFRELDGASFPRFRALMHAVRTKAAAIRPRSGVCNCSARHTRSPDRR